MHDDFESFFENTAVGNIFTSSQGVILRVNRRLAGWLGKEPDDLIGRRFSDVLTMGGKIYLETHLFPMLRMQGEFEEVMLELKTKGDEKLAVLVNGFEQRDAAGTPTLLRFAIVRAKNRLIYEQNLRRAGKQVQEALASAEGTLLDERETAALREQFIAVLGHDLRNPLAAVDAGARFLEKSPLDDRQTRILLLMQAAIRRMGGLIDDIMDLARGRLGSGIPVKEQETDLAPVLQEVVDELRGAHPDRTIELDLQLPVAVVCDGPKVAQLASNLIANAIAHGAPEGPISVVARSVGTGFELSVGNLGEPIPPDAVPLLFQPFTRAATGGKDGLGLGLYIASEIARAHGGLLEVESTPAMTIFKLRLRTSE